MNNQALNDKRSLYIPKDFTQIDYPDVNGVLYTNENDEKPIAIGFSGKRSRPDFNYIFRSASQLTEYVNKWIHGLKQRQLRKEADRAERRAFRHTLKVGDILSASWGYEQTNIEFYQVTRIVGKRMIEIRELAQDKYEDGFLQGTTSPVPDRFISSPQRVMVQHGNCIKVHSCAYASLYIGKPLRWSSYH